MPNATKINVINPTFTTVINPTFNTIPVSGFSWGNNNWNDPWITITTTTTTATVTGGYSGFSGHSGYSGTGGSGYSGYNAFRGKSNPWIQRRPYQTNQIKHNHPLTKIFV